MRLSEAQAQALAALDQAGALTPSAAIPSSDTRLTVFGANLWNRACNGGLVEREQRDDGVYLWITRAGTEHVAELRAKRAAEERAAKEGRS